MVKLRMVGWLALALAALMFGWSEAMTLYSADTTPITSIILVVGAVGVWDAFRGDTDSALWAQNASVRLGLFGTLYGFFVALYGLRDVELTLENVGAVLQSVTEGMGIAITTTLAGLMVAILLSRLRLEAEK